MQHYAECDHQSDLASRLLQYAVLLEPCNGSGFQAMAGHSVYSTLGCLADLIFSCSG
jgi:hypothetical protein